MVSLAGCLYDRNASGLQDAAAVLFCSEDRAIICRECDFMIHTANELTAKHSRYYPDYCCLEQIVCMNLLLTLASGC